MWQLVGEGLVYLDPEGQPMDLWRWKLSESAVAALNSGVFEPHDPDGYLRALRRAIPDLDAAVIAYLEEALRAFNTRCYLATSVLVGVASEKAMLDTAGAFADWLPEGEGTQFRKVLDNPRGQFSAKLPVELSDSMALHLDAVADLLRVTRNDAGHPTGRAIDRDTAYVNLQMCARYLQRLWALKAFFRSGVAP